MNCVTDVTTSFWTRNSSIIKVGDSESNLTTEVAAVIKETDFIYGKKDRDFTPPLLQGDSFHGRLSRLIKWKACDVGEEKEGLENELWRRWGDGKVGEWALLYISISMSSAHSPTLQSLYLRHSSFSNPSVASPTSQLILQPFCHFSYVTGSSLTSPGEPPIV